MNQPIELSLEQELALETLLTKYSMSHSAGVLINLHESICCRENMVLY